MIIICILEFVFWNFIFMPYLSVILPCYNEEKNLQIDVLLEVYQFLINQSFESEIIIVDDGSSDNSVALIEKFIADKPIFRLIKNPHQGKAYTVITGILQGSGQYILFSDFDQATPISEINKFLPFFRENYDAVIGSRSSERKGAPLFRLLMARGFMLLRTLILGLKGISDTQCGFKAFRKEVAHDIFNRLKLYGQKQKEVKGSLVTAGFDVEFLFLAKKLGYKIKEVPVNWHYVETRRVNPLKESWLGLTDMIKLRVNDIMGKYDQG